MSIAVGNSTRTLVYAPLAEDRSASQVTERTPKVSIQTDFVEVDSVGGGKTIPDVQIAEDGSPIRVPTEVQQASVAFEQALHALKDKMEILQAILATGKAAGQTVKFHEFTTTWAPDNANAILSALEKDLAFESPATVRALLNSFTGAELYAAFKAAERFVPVINTEVANVAQAYRTWLDAHTTAGIPVPISPAKNKLAGLFQAIGAKATESDVAQIKIVRDPWGPTYEKVKVGGEGLEDLKGLFAQLSTDVLSRGWGASVDGTVSPSTGGWPSFAPNLPDQERIQAKFCYEFLNQVKRHSSAAVKAAFRQLGEYLPEEDPIRGYIKANVDNANGSRLTEVLYMLQLRF